MKEQQIIQLALENLKLQLGLEAHWDDLPHDNFNGNMEISFDNKLIVLNAIVKQEVRNHQLAQIMNQTNGERPVILIANRIFPSIKEELRINNIAYLETNGNLFLKQPGVYLWIDTKKTNQNEIKVINRAFTKTGLKVLYQFLLNDNLINKPYREIAELVNVGLGNINYVMNGLKELDFLLKLNNNENKLVHKKDLFEKWLDNYNQKLKPDLKMGTFRFANENDFLNWKNVELNYAKTCWGGEAAGDLLTNYLRPEILTIYTCETRNELIRNYKLIPDINGNVEIYNMFWEQRIETGKTVPPLLAYTDLINMNDKRCRETAEQIYEQYIKPNL